MRFRTGLIIGFGVGYVLGAKAGRERYEQIVQYVQSLTENPKVQEVASRGKAVADLAAAAVGTGLQSASSRVRRAADTA